MPLLRVHPPLALALIFSVPVVTAAQETTGGVRGRLHSTVTGPVANARISATSPHLLGARSTVSATDGVFHFTLLPPGAYTLRVAAIGNRPLVIQNVQVHLGRITGLGDLVLEPAAVELGEVHVTAPATTLDPMRTTIGATLTTEDYALLPAERDYTSAIAILPHVNASAHGDPVNVGGSTGLENVYFIDGVNTTSALTAARGTSLPYNFVRAVEVKAGGYQAEYGKALGAVVNAVTYTGTNQLESQVFGFVTHDALAANPRAQPSLRESGSVSYDVGVRVSGPMVRDRLWFSAAYNPRVERKQIEIPGLGSYTDRTVAHILAGKLTWQATPPTTLELSLFGDPTTQHAAAPPVLAETLTPLNADPFLRRLESGGLTASLRATTVLGPLALEAHLAFSRGKEGTLPETDRGSTQPQYQDRYAGTVEGGIGFIRDVSTGRSAALVRGHLAAGRHELVAGIEYEDMRVRNSISLSGGAWIFRDDSAAWRTTIESSAGRFRNRIPTLYLQDSWRATDRVTLSAGLRWSAQLLSGASGGTAQRFPNEWQPRVGFSWQLGRQAAQRLFGSYGRFYQQIPMNVSSLWYADYIAVYSSYSTDPREPGATPDDLLDATTYEEDWARSIDGIAVEHFDEFTLGYERLLGATNRLTVRGIRRDLRSSFQWGLDPSLPQVWVLGTPGKGEFAFLPPPKREYTALELALEGSHRRWHYRSSYVLSRTWGNYSGLYTSDIDLANPGGSFTFFTPWQASNSTGLLPNDRTHVFKLQAAYRSGSAMGLGASLTVESGIPRNDFGAAPVANVFLAPRGTVGRTPALWDLNLRATYDLPWSVSARARVVMDVLHVGNPRKTLQVDEQHYFGLDDTGEQSNPNPNYLRPTAFQPPMSARLGFELNW